MKTLFGEFVTEQLMEGSTIDIHAPVAKVNIPVLKTCDKPIPTRMQEKS